MKVMTRNLYLGASLDPVTSAASPDELLARVDEVWAAVAASDPPARMAAVAREIAEHAPDVVALQEVALWRAAGGQHDLLALLLAALEGAYRVAAAGTNFGGALPGSRAGEVALEDRGVLLVREGVEARGGRAERYAVAARLAVAGGEVEVPRGLATAVVRAGGIEARVVGTHLELAHLPPLAAVQRAQAGELAALVRAEPLPIVVAGDLNSRPGEPAHAALVAAGLDDAWASVHGADPGFTCCQERSLRDPRSLLSERIDHLLVRGLRARGAWRTGTAPAGGLWPSDHAGVVAELER